MSEKKLIKNGCPWIPWISMDSMDSMDYLFPGFIAIRCKFLSHYPLKM
jgi:hypothetical protein